jgi:cystathionine beta-lyase/cystathionine gamma-synthase
LPKGQEPASWNSPRRRFTPGSRRSLKPVRSSPRSSRRPPYEQDEPGVNRGFDYSRTNNPTRARLETVLAELEGVAYCATFGSGLAAENAVLQAYLKPGDEIVIPLDVYGGTYRILNKVFKPLGAIVKQIDLGVAGTLEAALSSRRSWCWIESPTKPALLVYDIAAIARRTHKPARCSSSTTPSRRRSSSSPSRSAPTSSSQRDEVSCWPLRRHPGARAGARGVGVRADQVPPERDRRGAGPFDCWLTLRGLKTLELRMQRHADNAEAIREGAERTSAGETRLLPGLPEHPGHEIAKRQMTGFGGMFSFELDGTVDEVGRSFVAPFFALGESPRRRQGAGLSPGPHDHASIPAEGAREARPLGHLVRLSTGCEHQRDSRRGSARWPGGDRTGARIARNRERVGGVMEKGFASASSGDRYRPGSISCPCSTDIPGSN